MFHMYYQLKKPKNHNEIPYFNNKLSNLEIIILFRKCIYRDSNKLLMLVQRDKTFPAVLKILIPLDLLILLLRMYTI